MGTAGSTESYDVVVVGAGPGGSAAATFLGRQGLRVALLEKSPDPEHHKTLCTHEISDGALGTLDRLGITDALRELGGPHASPDVWTRYGWIRPRAEAGEPPLEQGLNVRRAKVDPLLRALAAGTPGVELLTGVAVDEVLTAEGRVTGVVARHRDGERTRFAARLVVAADGRSSRVADLAGLPAKERRHERLGYAAYFAGVPDDHGGVSRMWLNDPDAAYAFPTDGGEMLCAVMPLRTDEAVAAFRTDPEREIRRVLADVPGGPDLSGATMVGKPIGALKVTNQRRRAAAPGIACVGDAAMVSDYIWGTGIGYALRSAEWLGELVGPALLAGGDRRLDRALQRYRFRHGRMLAGHYWMANDYATGRRFTPPERLLYGAAVHDQTIARRMHEMGGRGRPVEQLLTPALLFRAARVRAGLARRRRHQRTPVATG